MSSATYLWQVRETEIDTAWNWSNSQVCPVLWNEKNWGQKPFSPTHLFFLLYFSLHSFTSLLKKERRGKRLKKGRKKKMEGVTWWRFLGNNSFLVCSSLPPSFYTYWNLDYRGKKGMEEEREKKERKRKEVGKKWTRKRRH